ncbi:SDR family oxidoreductase [Streptomyces sp. NP160]|uniref:SDR family oxidoreductase n=1 Tax=Streptomyces sp. NP160 TaxID=2586637 RepID=UPI00111BA368|nr:SDR family oxidoreductase [Streptomyces sp. NP160]TNM70006.1 SDR family oxidoreductase [Streptomyces sp. NP160]
MPTYAVTGATGPFGHHAVEELLRRGTAPGDVVALVRNPARAADLAERGVVVREFDYDRPETLAPALAGVDALLLVSGSAIGQRERQHGAVIDAAVAAGVGRIAYTSVLRADSTDLPVAPEHVATERLLAASGIPTALLRNGWYTENYAGLLGQAEATGSIASATRGASVSPATRADLAAAAAAALLDETSAGRTYELGGPSFTLDELAAASSRVLGREVVHHEVTPEQLSEGLVAAGLDEGTAGFLVAVDVATAGGALQVDTADLQELLGRPATGLDKALRAARP